MSDLVRTKLESTLRVKSLSDLVRVKTSEEIYLLIDVSGSMRENMRNGKQKISGLRETVDSIKKQRPVKMIAFGGHDGGAYVTSGVPAPDGGTPLHSGIDLARTIGAGRAIVISDGQPNDTQLALDAAKAFGGKIDVVFVGDPGGYGESFLKQLAEATGGVEFHGDLSEPKELGAAIVGLITAGTDEADGD